MHPSNRNRRLTHRPDRITGAAQELEKQNATLKRLLAEAELEKAALKELAEGNF